MGERGLDVIRISLFDTRPLSRGREVRLGVLGGRHAGEYDVNIDSADREHLFLTPVMVRGKPVELAPGTKVTLAIATVEDRCEFASVVAEPPGEAKGLLVLVLPPEAQRLQRRRHLRVGTELPVSVARLPGEGEPLSSLRFVDGYTKNLSEGGLAAVLPDIQLIPGDLVALIMLLPGARHKLRATCEVLRAGEGTGAWALRFADLDERMAMEFRTFIEQRRRQRRNGKSKLPRGPGAGFGD